MKHTKGPWFIEGESGNVGEGHVICNEVRTIAWTANSWDGERDVEFISDEDKANAQGISALPGLLEACKDALEFLRHPNAYGCKIKLPNDWEHMEMVFDLDDALYMAIEKATGEKIEP